uniref:Uncharacterized protein n=1 Tax=Romanomermis culicivorax TaxID=13658 RepID=A0A915L7Y2_ROMCU
MDAEIIESLINDNLDDFYFSSQLESDLLKSSTLNLEQTSLKAVNYRSYYLHFLLGSILSLPSFPKLMDKLRIEDIFLKWHISQTSGSENGKDYVLKLAITMKKQNNERAIVYRSFSFDPKLSSMFESSEVSDNDVKDLVLALRNKDRKIDDYSFDDIFHHAIVKPENDRPYRIRQEFNVIMENSKAFKFLDTFQTLSSANSPVRIFELPQMFVNMRQKLEEYKTARYDIQTDHFVDVISHSKLGDLDHIYSTEDMVTFLDRVAELYQIYDKVFKMKFSSSRIDHCAFLHGILLINMKNRYNLQINVENGEIMNYDTIQMVLKSSSKNIHDSAAILEKPLVLEFQDQGGETGALNIISKIRRIGYVKLLPQIQTLAKECTFFAVNFISPFARVKMIQIPLRKLQPDSSNSILELIRKAARDLFSVEQRGRDNDLILKEDIMKEFLWKIRNFVETIQSGNILYRVPDDVRYLSRYIVGEAATSNLPTYVVDYSDYEMDYFDCITTFVVCTESTDYDIILNIFEGPKSMSNVNMDFLLKKSNSKLAKRLQIDLRLFPRHELNEFQYSTDFQMKDFIDKLITIHEFYDISGDKTGSAPLVRIPEVRNLQISHLSPEHPSIPNMVSRLTKNFLYIMRDTISDEKNLEAMFRGILHKHNIVSISDNFPDQRSLISADEHSKLIRLRFFVSNGKSQRLLQRTAALKIHQNHVHKTYSIIFNKDTESVRDTVAVVHDRGSQTKNLQKYVAECKSASKVKRSRNCIRILDTKFEKSTSRLKQVLHKMNTFSSITAHGMLAKDMIADLINGEWTSLAVNVGLVASGFVLSRGADELAKIAIAGKSALSYAVKLGAPFLRRLTSGFVIYDLIQNMQDTKDENFAVNIVQDSTFLLVDTVDIGLEIAETVGFTASEYLGPVGMAVGVAVWIGGDIYKTVKTLNRLDERLNLDADNLTVHTKNMISEVSTNLSFMEIMHTYEKLHVQLKSLLIVQMIQANTVIMFAHHLLHSNLTILQNDPSKMTHFFQGPEENVFVINFVSNRIPSFRDVTIHRPRHFEESFADVIDLKMLRTVQHKVSCFSHGENIIIRIWIQNWYLSKIILKNFATNVRLFEKTLLRVGNVPMKIHYNGTFALVPVPLKFNRNEKMIIVDTVDVEYGHLIYIDRRITRYHLFHIHKNDMLLTNDLFNVHNRARFLLILRNFYQNDKMRTIKLNFLERQFDMSSLEFNVEEALQHYFIDASCDLTMLAI